MTSETQPRNGRQMIEGLKVSRPDVAITVSRFEDPQPWEGDGPAPDDCRCYTWTVQATRIVGGMPSVGEACLGSSWYRPADNDDVVKEIGGYLPQMIDEALADLDQRNKEEGV